MRSCSRTTSTPVTISLTGCSTWRRALISRKPKRRPLLVDEELARGRALVLERADEAHGGAEDLVRERLRAGPARAPPRPASGSGAGACSRGGRGGSTAPWRSASTCTSTWRARRTKRSTNSRPSPNACCASAEAAVQAPRSSSGRSTRRMPRPPPPPAALSRIGKPTSSATAPPRPPSRPRRSRRPIGIPRLAGRGARGGLVAAALRIASGPGPTNAIPASTHASDSSGRSETKP